MIKTIILLALTINILLADYDGMLWEEKNPKGAIKELKQLIKKAYQTTNFNDQKFARLHRFLAYSYIANGNSKLAENSMINAIGTSDFVHFNNGLTQLNRLYPIQKSTISKMEKFIKKLPSIQSNWSKIGIDDTDIHFFRHLSYDTPNKAQEFLEQWKPIRARDVLEWKRNGINNPQKAKKWIDVGVKNQNFVTSLRELNINSPKEYKQYSNIGKISHIKILKELNIKPTQLIEKMSEYSEVYYRTLFFESKERFKKRLKILQSNGCKTIEAEYFSDADEYDNEGLCYVFGGKLFQRLDRYTGLVSGLSGRTIFAKFDKSWREGEGSLGIMKGLGNFSYKTSSGSTKNVSKGKVLFRNSRH